MMKIVCPLDLPHVRYHVCVNDCIIYRHEYADSTVCPKCGVNRYKKTKKAPKKRCGIFRSLLVCSIISRTLSKLSSCVGMRKGSNKKKKLKNDLDKDIMLSHPSDGTQWEALNFEVTLGKDPGNAGWFARTKEEILSANQGTKH